MLIWLNPLLYILMYMYIMIFFYTYVLLFSVPICWPLFPSNDSSFIIPPIFISIYLASHPVSLFTFFLLSLVSNPFFPLILSFLLFSLSPTLDLFCFCLFWLFSLTLAPLCLYPLLPSVCFFYSLSLYNIKQFSLSVYLCFSLCVCLSVSLSLSYPCLPLPGCTLSLGLS